MPSFDQHTDTLINMGLWTLYTYNDHYLIDTNEGDILMIDKSGVIVDKMEELPDSAIRQFSDNFKNSREALANSLQK